MRFVPVPHFAYFKVLNGITSKLLVLNHKLKAGDRRPAQLTLLPQLGLSGCLGWLVTVNVRRLEVGKPVGTG